MPKFEVSFFDRMDKVTVRGEVIEMAYNERTARVDAANEAMVPFALRAAGYNVEKILKIRTLEVVAPQGVADKMHTPKDFS